MEIELNTAAASLDCAASSPICDDISMVVAGFTSTSALADDVVLVSRDSVVKAFWSQMINYDSIQYLGLSKRKRGYMHTAAASNWNSDGKDYRKTLSSSSSCEP